MLFEWFASDAVVGRHSVASDMEGRQCPSCVSYMPLQDWAVKADCRTDLSLCEVPECTIQCLDGLVRSMPSLELLSCV